MVENVHEITKRDTVYIAGPMTGISDYNREQFNLMSDYLERTGCRVLNPGRQPDGLSYAEYMRRAMADLSEATAVVFLRRWDDSRGALFENAAGRMLRLRFYRQTGAICPIEGVSFIPQMIAPHVVKQTTWLPYLPQPEG